MYPLTTPCGTPVSWVKIKHCALLCEMCGYTSSFPLCLTCFHGHPQQKYLTESRSAMSCRTLSPYLETPQAKITAYVVHRGAKSRVNEVPPRRLGNIVPPKEGREPTRSRCISSVHDIKVLADSTVLAGKVSRFFFSKFFWQQTAGTLCGLRHNIYQTPQLSGRRSSLYMVFLCA